MRTTLTLDPDVAQRLKARMASENTTLKELVNDALRRGLSTESRQTSKAFQVTPHSFGLRAGIDVHKLNQLADDLETEAFASGTSRGKKRR